MKSPAICQHIFPLLTLFFLVSSPTARPIITYLQFWDIETGDRCITAHLLSARRARILFRRSGTISITPIDSHSASLVSFQPLHRHERS